MAKLLIPGPLRRYTSGNSVVIVEGDNVSSALGSLFEMYSDIKGRLVGEDGTLHRFVNIFINSDDIRMYDGLNSKVSETDTLEIIPAISGGNNFGDLAKKLRSEIIQVSSTDLSKRIGAGESIQILDVRSSQERNQGYITNSIHIDRGFLEINIERDLVNKDAEVIVYCASGVRSLLAANTLRSLGYINVKSLDAGFEGWKSEGFGFEQPKLLSESQRAQYLRHLSLPEVGESGQIKLLESKVLCIGAGGLGSPTLMYLAAAGIGTIGIIDNDVVDVSNLQRQIIHNRNTVGEKKTSSAKQFIQNLNSDVDVVEYDSLLNAENAEAIFSEFDIIVDGSDNFSTRYLVNDVCQKLGKPFVHGSIFRFEGQLSVFIPGDGPCYRCVYPEPPSSEFAPSCGEAGVLGVLPGVIGVLSAVEVIKLILNIGASVKGKLLTYDAMNTSFRELNLFMDKQCLCQKYKDRKKIDIKDEYGSTCSLN